MSDSDKSDRGVADRESFLARWSRRKADGDDAESPLPVEAVETDPSATTEVEDEGDPAVIAELPDIETLDAESDYSVFMQDGVPERLRNLALRKLWLSDPVFANLDGLNDYDEDFGAILREGATYMKQLVDAGERMTRPGEDSAEVAETDDLKSDEAKEASAEENAEDGNCVPVAGDGMDDSIKSS